MAQLDLFAKTFIDDTTALHNWVQGDENTTVNVAGGPLDSPRKLIKQWNAEVNLASDGVLAQAVAAKNSAQQAANDAAATLNGAVKTTELSTPSSVAIGGFSANEIQSLLDNSLMLGTYSALRAYTGRALGVRITSRLIAGDFVRDSTDNVSSDNGGTTIIDGAGRRWKRYFAGMAASVLWFGAGAAGATDDTPGIRAAFAAEKFVTISKIDRKYIIDAVDPNYPTSSYGGGVKPQNESFITCEGGAEFIAKSNANSVPAYVIVNLRDTINVTIYNLPVNGTVDTHTGTPGEWGMGFYIAGAINPRLFNCVGRKCWGDGFYVGNSIETSTNPTTGGVLSNCLADDNRRQGLSIVSWSKGLVDGGEFNNTGKTKFVQPAFGIDIEPDPSGQDVIDVILLGVRTFGNKYGGLQLVPGFMTASTYASRNYRVTVIGYESNQDGGYGALRFANPDLDNANMVVSNKINGSIRMSGVRIVESVGRGVDWARWIPASPDVFIDGIEVIDANTSGNTATLQDQSAIVLFMASGDLAKQTGHGKVTIRNLRVFDTRAVPKTVLAVDMSCVTGQYFSGVTIHNPEGSGWSSTANGVVRVVNAAGVSVTFDNPPLKDFSANTGLTNGAFAGYSIASTISTVISLPPANTSVGLRYLFENRYGVTMQIRPDAADTIVNFGRTAGNDAVLSDKADLFEIKSIGGNSWEVTRNIGKARPLGFSRPPTIVYVSSIHTTGTYQQGDRAVNVLIATGAVREWGRATNGSGHVSGTDWIPQGTW